MGQSFIIDELDADTTAWIDQEARRTGTSIDVVARRLIHRAIQFEKKQAEHLLHHDLDDLAGTWSAEESADFLRAIDEFDQIDLVPIVDDHSHKRLYQLR